MKVTFSQTADAMLGPYVQSHKQLLAALGGVPGQCFIDGKVGRIPGNDDLVFRSPNLPALTLSHAEFADPAAVERLIEEWLSSASG